MSDDRLAMLHDVTLNGIDPDGETPPDEVLHHPDDGDCTDLIRVRDGWELRVYIGTDLEWKERYDDFAPAFAKFAEMAGVEHGVVA